MREQNGFIILDAGRITKRTLFIAAAHTDKTARKSIFSASC
jgi:hypothetical protein